MNAPVLAPLTVADLEEVALIENVSFTAPWPTSAYVTELTTNRLARYVGARIDGALVGFGGIWLMVDEAHITTMAVLPAIRRNGVATALLLELLQEARRGGARVATLDVRVSNLDAQRLYLAFGFVEVGRRIRYYDDNDEDALVMTTAELESSVQLAIEARLRSKVVERSERG
ncbi:MAG: ribosomal-protein-alanine N-acetyltransferase [bacterium]|nr:ribosomal-protein-alanine N-acetyltransferase [Candidatus Aquidulcis frankliniae]